MLHGRAMRAVRITGRGGPEVLSLADVPEPVPGPDELLVRVRASALNRADLLQCMGLYPAPPGAPADIPGLEFAGEIDAVGERVRTHRVGDEVMGIVGGGAFAEKLVLHEREAIRLPARATMETAAAIPEAFFTAFDALVLQAGLMPGENVLIHAVASGVGTAASQLAAALGARVVGTSRSEAKLKRCEDLGVSMGIRVTDPPRFAEEVKAAFGGRGADVVLELAGGDYLDESIAAAAPRARIVLIGLLAGTRAELNLAAVLQKRVSIVGTTLRSRPIEEKIALALAFERHALPLFDAGKLEPVIDSVEKMDHVADALRRIAENRTVGKIVLTW